MDALEAISDRLTRLEGWVRDLHLKTGGFPPPPQAPEPTAAELEAAHPANQPQRDQEAVS